MFRPFILSILPIHVNKVTVARTPNPGVCAAVRNRNYGVLPTLEAGSGPEQTLTRVCGELLYVDLARPAS